MLIRLSIAAILFAGNAFAADPQDYSKMPPDLAARAKVYDDAQLNSDGKALQDVLADDYMLVGGDATFEDKTKFIHKSTDPNFKLQPFHIAGQIVKLWPNGAVLGGRVALHFTDHGKPGQTEFQFADVWAKRGGTWRVIFTEVTRIPKK